MAKRSAYNDKTGLKRGAWSVEEDKKLTDYIMRYGHWNWRELPRFAGLSRCGKSCRLRWMNYLRPDIKRGNFSKEEEEIIINLHESFGNRWSAIAAELPGRTDNEIKNHWHTHLKKRLKQNRKVSEARLDSIEAPKCETESRERGSGSNTFLLSCPTHPNLESSSCSSSSMDSTSSVALKDKVTDLNTDSTGVHTELGTSFWTEPFLVGDPFMQENYIETLYPFGFYNTDCTDYCFNQLHHPVELSELCLSAFTSGM